MLSRCYDVIFRIFLIYLALEWTVRASSRLCCDLRFNFNYTNCIEPALVALFMGTLLWLNDRHLVREPIARFLPPSPELGPSLKKTLHWDGFRFALLGCSFFSLCLFPILGGQATFDNALKTAASCFEGINQYELAEKIYQRVSYKGIYSTLATWQTRSKKEDQRREAPRNTAVANVYGKNSLQMAERCFFVASSRMCHDDNDMHDEIAYSWFEKAEKIYEENHAPGGEIDCLSQMVFIKDDPNNLDSCALIKKAAVLAVNVGEVRYDYHYDGLQSMAAQKGLREESIAFAKVSDRLKHSAAAASDAADDKVRPYVIGTAVLLAVLAARLGQVTLSELSLNRLNRDLLKRFMETADNQMQFALLNNSITIDLMQNNSEVALAKSEYLLQLAHGNSLTLQCLPSNFDWLAERRKAIFTRETFSAVLAAVVAGAMFV